jgi:hypothetical protein
VAGKISHLRYTPVAQNPDCKAVGRSFDQEIPRLILNLKVNYWVHKKGTLNDNLHQEDSVHVIAHHFCLIHFNIIFQLPDMSPEFYLTFRFSK